MWPRVILGEARVAAGGCRAILSRLAVPFSPPWATGSGSPLRRSLHGTATRAFPLIPIVVEQTVRGLGGVLTRRLVVGGRAGDADLSPRFSFHQGRGERAYDIYSRLLRERIVCVMGPVSDPLFSGNTLLSLQHFSPCQALCRVPSLLASPPSSSLVTS